MLKFACIGASQTHAVRNACLERQKNGAAEFEFTFFFIHDPAYEGSVVFIEDGKIKFRPRFDADFREFVANGEVAVIFTYLGGAEHVPLSLVENARPYDVLFPGEALPATTAERQFIPYDVMLATCQNSVSGWPVWFPHLRELSDRPICHIALPPPITGDDHIRAGAGDAFREQIERYGIAPERLRGKVWRLCTIATEQVCAQHSIRMIAAPPETLDDNDCLLPEYRSDDAVHPNAKYGDLLLDRMLTVAQELSG